MKLKGTMLSAALAMSALPLAAQQQTPIDAQQAQAWVAEAQQIGQRLAALQEQVLSDPAIAQERDELTERVEEAMSAADPALEQDLARAEGLEPAMAAAQQAGDEARMNALLAEARELETRFMQAQQTALADPELSRVVLAFNELVQDRMTALDPETPRLIARLGQIRDRLQGANN